MIIACFGLARALSFGIVAARLSAAGTAFRTAVAVATLVATTAISQIGSAATKTVTFGWEDGTSTVNLDVNMDSINDLPPLAISPDTSSVTLANVSSGNQVDLPSMANFPVSPFSGSRMLEATITPNMQDSGTDAVVYLGVVSGLDVGDTYSFKYRTHDPTADRSPSVPPNATYADTADITSNAGFAVPVQTFISGASGWLETILDADGNQNTQQDPVVTYSPAGTANAVRPEADFFYQSASVATMTPSTYYIDDLEITVTSANPNATIWLPDGTKVLVNSAGVAGDYNGNGTVDAADYVVWRNGGPLQNEVSGVTPGTVTAEDYDAWRARFGNVTGSGSGAAVPEPASVVLLLLGMAAIACGRRIPAQAGM